MERSQLRWLGHLFRMPPGRLPREVFQACPTGRRPLGKTQDTLGRLCLSAGLGTPRGPPGRAGGRVWGEGSLGISAQTAASATRSRIKQMKMDGWMLAIRANTAAWLVARPLGLRCLGPWLKGAQLLGAKLGAQLRLVAKLRAGAELAGRLRLLRLLGAKLSLVARLLRLLGLRLLGASWKLGLAQG
ncbi:hypothetical protein L3Q82_023016 [Scortum barcoo]|uniref:Uncharacterized protein n=1 Tax=Scortum barcoo TaxID=214431 RepID=A0ACB8WXR7_9TELE|nr:hypothetical protein L3Q82_023016 [Scortum barcoo]